MTSRLRLLVAAAALVFGVSAAALVRTDPSAARPVATATPGVDPRSGGFQVGLGEWGVGLEAKAIRPGPVTLVVTNRGKLAHGLEIEAARSRDGGDDNDLDEETERLRPGQTARITLVLAPGVYEIECFVSDHDDLGMVARLVVSADAPLVAPPKPPANTVQIANFAFKPATLTTRVGATVRWRNADAAPHTATALDRSFDSKTLARNGTYARRFTRAGTYAYLCALHPSMTGRVVVR